MAAAGETITASQGLEKTDVSASQAGLKGVCCSYCSVALKRRHDQGNS